MSKNFELLLQIGNDEELFRTAVQPEDAAVAVECEPGAALDQETFERVMEKASLMGLFQTSNESAQQTPGKGSEVSPGSGVEASSREAPGETTAHTFRTSRNPASPIEDPGMSSESRRSRNDAMATHLINTFHGYGKPNGPLGPTNEKTLLDAKTKPRQRSHQKRSTSSSWLDSIKGAVKGWGSKGVLGNNHGGNLEAITREQEIRLVQRVFPETTPDSTRVGLFACLESEAGCAPTCARVAELLAARGEGPVCVVDANFLTPSLHEYFGVENVNGLAEATVESGPIQRFAQQVPEPDLWLIPSGKAGARLRFPAMVDGLRARIEELRNTFKYVVIHSGPLRPESSAMLLSRWTDGVVLVVEANATRRDTARRVKGMLDAANINLLGVVLNNRTLPIPEAIYRRL
jgi:protein-tyrosine kinase